MSADGADFEMWIRARLMSICAVCISLFHTHARAGIAITLMTAAFGQGPALEN
jgi:hypothetical protein